jgi:hypothetical protein
MMNGPSQFAGGGGMEQTTMITGHQSSSIQQQSPSQAHQISLENPTAGGKIFNF